jgi:hypothetical protein
MASGPNEVGHDPFNYYFPGKNALDLPREDGINHFLLDRGILRPRCLLGGGLVATGSSMPEHLCHGAGVELALTLVASDSQCAFGKSYIVGRPVQDPKQEPSRKIPSGSLFAKESARTLER